MENFSYYFIGHIGVFESVFSEEECQNIINYFENHVKFGETFTRKQSERGIPKTKKDDLTYFHQNTIPNEVVIKDAPHLESLIEKIGECWQYYKEEYDILISDGSNHSICPSIRIQKTDIGGGYHLWHFEHGSASSARLAAYTIYLNDVEEGGETEFLYQHMRVPAKRGSVCFFPAGYTHTHRGNPPLSNEKYIITGWIDFIR